MIGFPRFLCVVAAGTLLEGTTTALAFFFATGRPFSAGIMLRQLACRCQQGRHPIIPRGYRDPDLSFSLSSCGSSSADDESSNRRNAKYNQLMRIEEELGDAAVYAGKAAFTNLNMDI